MLVERRKVPGSISISFFGMEGVPPKPNTVCMCVCRNCFTDSKFYSSIRIFCVFFLLLSRCMSRQCVKSIYWELFSSVHFQIDRVRHISYGLNTFNVCVVCVCVCLWEVLKRFQSVFGCGEHLSWSLIFRNSFEYL